MSRSNRSANLHSERISITLKSARREGESEETELPLNMLTIGNFQSVTDDIPLHERTPISIDKHRFTTVMEETAPRLKTTVTNHLSSPSEGDPTNGKNLPELALDIRFRSMDDFHPDHIIRKVPELGVCRT